MSSWSWLWQDGNLTFLLEGFVVNLELALIAGVLSLLVGAVLGVGTLSRRRWLRVPVTLWVDFWRNLPALFILLYLLLVLPSSWGDAWASVAPHVLTGSVRSDRALAAILGLTVYNSASIAEIVRAGIQSIPSGQILAARSLGLSRTKVTLLISLPQGLRNMTPATVSQLVSLIKDTSLVSILALADVLGNAGILTSFNFFGDSAPYLQVFTVVAAMFICVNFALSSLSRFLESRTGIGASKAKVSGLEDQAV